MTQVWWLPKKQFSCYAGRLVHKGERLPSIYHSATPLLPHVAAVWIWWSGKQYSLWPNRVGIPIKIFLKKERKSKERNTKLYRNLGKELHERHKRLRRHSVKRSFGSSLYITMHKQRCFWHWFYPASDRWKEWIRKRNQCA